MRLKDWLTKKAIEYQAREVTSLTDAIDQVLEKKAEKLKKEGKEVNKENLMAGWKALKILGMSKEDVEARVEEFLEAERKRLYPNIVDNRRAKH